MALEEAFNLPCPFTGQERADGINQLAAGLHQLSGKAKQPLLFTDKTFEPVRSKPPATLGIPPPRAAPRAGGVHQYEVGAVAPVGELLKLPRRAQQPRFDARAGTLSPRPKLGEAGAIAVRRENRRLRCSGCKSERLAACAGAQVQESLPVAGLACLGD